jgi:ATP-dependent protease ClpP protease subunit
MGKKKDKKNKKKDKKNKKKVKKEKEDTMEVIPVEKKHLGDLLSDLDGGVLYTDNDGEENKPVVSCNRNNVYYQGPITTDGIERCIGMLRGAARNSNADGIVTLRMNSTGGDIDDAFKLISWIQRTSRKVRFVGEGVIMSAAVSIMAAADIRLLDSEATVMVHGCTVTFDGGIDVSFGARDAAYDDNFASAKLFAVRGPYSEKDWMDLMTTGKDAYFTAENAVNAGLADCCFTLPGF